MRSRILAVAVLLICSAVASRAGGPAFIAGSGYAPGVEGQPLIWANGAVQYFTDQGDLSPILTNAQADAFVASAFNPWIGISSAALTASQGGHLAEDVNGSNIAADANGRSPPLRTLHLQPPVLPSELFTTTTERSPMRCWAKALEAWPIASPTPSTADPTTSPWAGTSCTRSW